MNHEELVFCTRALLQRPDRDDFAALVRRTHPSDLTEVLRPATAGKVAALLMLLEPRVRAALFAHFDPERQDELIAALPRKAISELFEHLPADDRADLFNRLDTATRPELLASLQRAEREDILRLSAYPEGTVGAATTSDFVAVSANMHVADALAHLRTQDADSETIYVLYVLDDDQRLCGTVSLRALVVADPQVPLSALMQTEPVFVRAGWPVAQAVALIRRYDLLAVPVINGGDRMIGIVTVDDAMDLDKEHDANQLARFGGAASTGGGDLDVTRTPLRRLFTVRLFWLAMLTVFGIITSTFVAAQEELLSSVIVLAAFIAPIVDMGGNTGSQSATLVIRSMALGELGMGWRHVWFVVRRELPVAAGLGITIAVLEAVLAFFSKGVGGDVLLVVGLSMLVCTALGGVIGAMLPFAARRIGADPATLSSPLITSIMDLLGVFIYFGFAWLLLSDQLRSVTS